ncbi:MAG: lipid II flippase MurJ [Edaphobacter sp.]|uniref:lipid II flippase MurJ n=1 Tax=Edaphobacter sp. TaxID=1934404 RepID=UPI00238FED2F|nr:lipid II flippase MurJ [Edaphobacter sp.]MDE1176414.1 lipid II flippase MurJ [Edaphobacter sp.]
MTVDEVPNPKRGRNPFARLRPSASQSASSAAILLMTSSLLSGVLGLVRTKYINYIFGAGPETDAYNAAFQLPEMISYFLVGGVASISLVTILNRYRAQGDDEGADRSLSIVLNAMIVVLILSILVAEVVAPYYTSFFFSGFGPREAALCTTLTRLLLPAQLFFFVGGVIGSRLVVRKIFLYQAINPLIYNTGIILGAVFLHRQFGIYSLAIGVLAGVILGPTTMNLFGALQSGFRYHPILNLRHPAFLEWLRLTFPLMVGVSLVTADSWILTHFASSSTGGITLLKNAKNLFTAPMGILGQAAGAASLPFFSALFSQGRHREFGTAVNRAVSRVLAASLLMGAWMIALATPLVDLFRGGVFTAADTQAMTLYFTVFAVSISFWAVQGLYARGFYAAGDTVTPAITGWIVTLISIPVYRVLFHASGLTGLAIASDIGIVLQTLTLAVLIQRKRLVSFAGLEIGEVAKALAAALVSWAGAAAVVRYVPHPHTHTADFLIIAAASLAWCVLAVAILLLTRSSFIRQLQSRF